MPTTFSELQSRLTAAKQRKSILLMLIEHVDEHFLPQGGAEPEKKLLDDDKLVVPVEMFEAVAADTLTAEVQQLDAEINQIMSSNLVVAPPAPPPEPTPAQVEPVNEPAPVEEQPA
jgi:hypothetical protein